MKVKSQYLEHLSSQLGVPEDQVFDSLVKSEFSYGVVAAFVSLFIVLFALWVLRFSYKQWKKDTYDNDGWIFGMVFAPLVMIGALIFTGNAAHHIMSPESYALQNIYQIVVDDSWSNDLDDNDD